jgi:hypothetical protein
MAFQVSVFLENKIGHFERVTRVLKDIQVNIRTMTLNNTANGWGILNLLVTDPEKAYAALSEQGFSVSLREVIALRMEDRPGGLDYLLVKIAEAGISFDNAVGRITEEHKTALLVLDVPDIESAREKLHKAGIYELPDDVVYGRMKI